MNINELRNKCQGEKLKKNTGLTRLNRNVSIYVTRFLIMCRVSANQVSIAGIMIGIVGSCCFLPGIFWWNVFGVFLLYVSLLCDQVDGELARFYETVNLNGVYIDEFRHLIIYSITIFCLSFPEFYKLDSVYVFLFGFVGSITLVLSRVESKMSYYIFTEKILLRDNFSGGTIKNNVSACGNNLQSNQGGKRKIISPLFYAVSHYLSHQVWILIWLLLVTVLDRYGIMNVNSLNLQSLLFLMFVLYNPIVFLKVVCGHFKEAKIENDCKKIFCDLND